MGELLTNLGVGLASVMATHPVEILGMQFMFPMNIFYCFVGALVGTLIGVLPGIGPMATIAMLLPATYALSPEAGLIMLAGIYYGAQYGGSTTAILINLPGEISSVVTTIEGYQMGLRGRGGVALTTAAVGSFFAGCVATVVISAFAPVLAGVAVSFGSAEYFSLMVLGLIGSVVLASGSLVKAICMTCLGLLGGLVGTDVNSGVLRYTFDIPELSDGVGFVAVAMGVFGFSEIIKNLALEGQERHSSKVTTLFPTQEDWKRMILPIVRGTGIGSFLGMLPGGGATLASFGSYIIEKKSGKHNAEFGQGAIEGVAGPESANNAAAQTSFIPMLTLGIPSNAVMALMIGAMMIHDIQPGPQVMTNKPTLFWGLIVSMWFGNLMLVILNLPLIGVWVKLLTVPYRLLYPAILVFSVVGVYAVNGSVVDVWIMAVMGALGYLLRKFDFETAPIVLGLVLAPMLEMSLRQSLALSSGSYFVFITRPISATMLGIGVVLLLFSLRPLLAKGADWRQKLGLEESSSAGEEEKR